MSDQKTYTQEEVDKIKKDVEKNTKTTLQSGFDAQKVELENSIKGQYDAKYSAVFDGLKDTFGVEEFDADNIDSFKEAVISKYAKGDVKVDELPEYKALQSNLKKASDELATTKTELANKIKEIEETAFHNKRSDYLSGVEAKIKDKTSVGLDRIRKLYLVERKLVENKDGEIIPMDGNAPKLDGSGKELSLADDYKAFISEFIQGDGGAGGGYGSGATVTKRSQLKTPKDITRFIEKNGVKAYEDLKP